MNYSSSGAGIAIDMFSTVTLANNLIINNSASAGGAYFWYAYPTILNSILWGDTAGDNTEIVNQGGTINISYSDISGATTGLGVVHFDPLFQNASNGDYGLSNASQIIGAGILQTIVPTCHSPNLQYDMNCSTHVNHYLQDSTPGSEGFFGAASLFSSFFSFFSSPLSSAFNFFDISLSRLSTRKFTESSGI